jgi:hypothetical protein
MRTYCQHLFAGIAFAASAFGAQADERSILIQLAADGHFIVWHGDGDSTLPEDDLLLLAASATAEGSATIQTALGPASATATRQGVVIHVPQARGDKKLLVDRDGCGAIKAWHGGGTVALTED